MTQERRGQNRSRHRDDLNLTQRHIKGHKILQKKSSAFKCLEPLHRLFPIFISIWTRSPGWRTFTWLTDLENNDMLQFHRVSKISVYLSQIFKLAWTFCNLPNAEPVNNLWIFEKRWTCFLRFNGPLILYFQKTAYFSLLNSHQQLIFVVSFHVRAPALQTAWPQLEKQAFCYTFRKSDWMWR